MSQASARWICISRIASQSFMAFSTCPNTAQGLSFRFSSSALPLSMRYPSPHYENSSRYTHWCQSNQSQKKALSLALSNTKEPAYFRVRSRPWSHQHYERAAVTWDRKSNNSFEALRNESRMQVCFFPIKMLSSSLSLLITLQIRFVANECPQKSWTRSSDVRRSFMDFCVWDFW
jgi:hypothetical protein